MFRKSFCQVAEAYSCELAYLEQLYDSTVEKLFCDLLPKQRIGDPLAQENDVGTYRKVIRDGYIPEFFIAGSLSEAEFVDEVSRVVRNKPLHSSLLHLGTKYVTDFTFNSGTFLNALDAAKDGTTKLGMERADVGPLRLSECICEEMQSPREVVIRLTYMFYVAVLGYTHKFYVHGKSVPLVTLGDSVLDQTDVKGDELAKEIASFCKKKKYEYDPSFLFTKKMDNLFKDETVYKLYPRLLKQIQNEQALKTAAKGAEPDSAEYKEYMNMCYVRDLVGAAIQFFKINVIAFFVDVADGKSVKDAFEKLLVIMACLSSMDIPTILHGTETNLS